ncbi:MAG: methyltransferase domain-containing protein [OCS116 cluster bacterium]|uniref:SAM-dependent methyltransferase n=1 Tax=OCS116 cluster bacterium TaxID=2030921 RepID=A0A2A4Z3W3_9PROT|nr:methyltransferase domain-containing protein [OCS116 cluster bacterium]
MQIINHKLLAKRRAQARVSSPTALKDNQFLLQNAELDLLDRLSIITREFETAVHIGGYNGSFVKLLRAHKVAKNCHNIESTGRAADIVADDEILPLKAQSVNLITSSLSLQFINDLPGLLAQIKRVLKPDGLFAANLIGGASLNELRESLLIAETELSGGATPRVLPFIDVQQMGSLLQRAGFALPVVDMDSLTVRYDHIFDVIKDLRSMGATNCLHQPQDTPKLTRAIIARAAEIYQQKFSHTDGRVTAQFDIINIIGWAPHESQQKPLKPGSAEHNLADFL